MLKVEVYLHDWEVEYCQKLSRRLAPDGDDAVPLEVSVRYALTIGLGQIAKEFRESLHKALEGA